MSRPRVMMLCSQPFFQWRGSPIRVRYNVEALSALGYEVDLITLPFGEDLEIPHVTLHRVSGLPGVRDIPIGPSIAKLVFDIKLFFKGLRMLRSQEIAVIHGIEDAGFFAGLLSRMFRKPFIYEKHSDPASYRKKGLRNVIMAIYARVETYSLRRADAVIATGAGLQARVRECAPHTPCAHIFDIPSSRKEPDPDEVVRLRSTLQTDSDDVLATYVGSFAVYQGIDLLFEGASMALQKQNNLKIVIIGGSEQEIQERKTVLADQGIADRVVFVGKVNPDDLPSFLAASDILLSPRLSGHNTPLKLLDYFKAGGAILATDLEANRLILDDTTAAFCDLTPDAFSAALIRLASSPEERARLAGKGRDQIDTLYNFESYTRQLGEVYHSLTSAKETE